MNFNLEFIIVLASALYTAYLIAVGSPDVPMAITYFLVPFLVAYLVLLIINNVFPFINQWGRNIQYYVERKTMSRINNTGYLQIFPPIFIVFIIFVLLLYNRRLG